MKVILLFMQIQFSNQTKLRVRYAETDQMGYCYYGNYAQYFEVGRVEAMRSLGMSYRELEEAGIMLPVIDFSVKYYVPATYDEELTVTTTIEKLQGAKLSFSYQINNEQGQLVVTAMTTLVFVRSETKRPTKAPENFLKLINQYIDGK
ncbi:MAG TPA: thioesterase family protein [Taishania sp.]|nr:thioesterase family protein [Taishania sp.]